MNLMKLIFRTNFIYEHEGEGFFEDNNMFSITNTLQSHEDNIDTDNNSRKKH